MADKSDLKSDAERHEGSSPSPGTFWCSKDSFGKFCLAHDMQKFLKVIFCSAPKCYVYDRIKNDK